MQLQFGQDFAGVETEILDYEVALLRFGRFGRATEQGDNRKGGKRSITAAWDAHV